MIHEYPHSNYSCFQKCVTMFWEGKKKACETPSSFLYLHECIRSFLFFPRCSWRINVEQFYDIWAIVLRGGETIHLFLSTCLAGSFSIRISLCVGVWQTQWKQWRQMEVIIVIKWNNDYYNVCAYIYRYRYAHFTLYVLLACAWAGRGFWVMAL